MASILCFPNQFTPHHGADPYEEDNRVFTPEAMDEFETEHRRTAVDALAA